MLLLLLLLLICGVCVVRRRPPRPDLLACNNEWTGNRYNEDLRSTSKAQQLAAFARFCATHMTATPAAVGNCAVLVAAFFEFVPVLKDFTPIVTRLLEDTDEVSSILPPPQHTPRVILGSSHLPRVGYALQSPAP